MAGVLYEVFVIKVTDPSDDSVRYVQDYNVRSNMISFITVKDWAKSFMRLTDVEQALSEVRDISPKYKYEIDTYMDEFNPSLY